MANRFWNFVVQMTAGTLAKAEDVNTNLSGVQTGFDDTAVELDQTIQITNSPGTTFITLNAAARALKLITFDASGNVVAVDDMGNWQGNHAGSTAYNERDIVKDAAGDIGLNNIYRANTSFTSSASMATDSANWDLVIDVTAVEAAKVASEVARDAAIAAKVAAELAYDNFDDRYLGDKSADPTLDNDGNALLTGALYFSTALNRMKVYNGTGWQLTTANAADIVIADALGLYATKNVEYALQNVVTLANTQTVSGSKTFSGDVDLNGLIFIGGSGMLATAAELNELAGNAVDGSDFTKLSEVTATSAELNIIDGLTSASAITAVGTDRVVYNDGGSMIQVALTTLSDYFRSVTETLTNKTLTSPVINTGVSGSAVDTDPTLAADSDTLLVSQKAVKAFVGLNTKVIDIGDWNMDVDLSTSVLHGVTQSKIRSIKVLIRHDDGVILQDYHVGNNLVQAGSAGDNIFLQREETGIFDSTAYDSIGFNRGWITIRYTD